MVTYLLFLVATMFPSCLSVARNTFGVTCRRSTIASLSPLLRDIKANPHSTLLSLYINDVMEMSHGDQSAARREVTQAMAYMDKPQNPADVKNMSWQLMAAPTLFRDGDKFPDQQVLGLHCLKVLAGADK